jgi:hypothetical protein
MYSHRHDVQLGSAHLVSAVKHSSSLTRASAGVSGFKAKSKPVAKIERSCAEQEAEPQTEALKAFVLLPVVARLSYFQSSGSLRKFDYFV